MSDPWSDPTRSIISSIPLLHYYELMDLVSALSYVISVVDDEIERRDDAVEEGPMR